MSPRKTLPDLEYLKSILRYDADSGHFTWIVNRTAGVKAGDTAGRDKGTAPYIYHYLRIDDTEYGAHRVAWLFMTKKSPDADIDHHDRNGLNNRWSNLRLATPSENAANSKRPRDNRTGFKGVVVHRNKGYRARIVVNGKILHLGIRSTPEAAHALYVAAAREHFGEFARTS